MPTLKCSLHEHALELKAESVSTNVSHSYMMILMKKEFNSVVSKFIFKAFAACTKYIILKVQMINF